MKIYSSKRYDNELDRFIGSDIWVLVKYTPYNVSHLMWIRIIRTLGMNSYQVNWIPHFYFDDDSDDYTCSCGDISKEHILTDTMIVGKDRVAPIMPLDIRTIDEIFGEEE